MGPNNPFCAFQSIDGIIYGNGIGLSTNPAEHIGGPGRMIVVFLP
jgi:hypothetical protein